MDLGRYINNLNTVLSDQQQKKNVYLLAQPSGMFSKSGPPPHKFTFFQPNKLIPGGPFRLVGGGGVRSHPSHPPAYSPGINGRLSSLRTLVLDQQIIVIRPFHFIQRSTIDDTIQSSPEYKLLQTWVSYILL